EEAELRLAQGRNAQTNYTYRNDSPAPEAGQPASPSKGSTGSEPGTENNSSPFNPSELSYAAQQRDEALSRYETQKKLFSNNVGGIRATSKEDLTGALRTYNKHVEEMKNREHDTFKPSELTGLQVTMPQDT